DSGRKFLAADIHRFVDFLETHGAESISQLRISCFPWRNGKRLQAVNERGENGVVTFDLKPGDERYEPIRDQLRREALIIRERPDELGNFGLATLFNHDD